MALCCSLHCHLFCYIFKNLLCLALYTTFFFPPLFSLILILALLSPLLPFLSPITAFYAQFLLRLVTHAPRRFSFYLYAKSLTPETTLIIFVILLAVGITAYQKKSLAKFLFYDLIKQPMEAPRKNRTLREKFGASVFRVFQKALLEMITTIPCKISLK